MKNARQLLEEFTASSFRDTKKAAEMFSEDGAFEMPYSERLGMAGRYMGRKEIDCVFQFVRHLYPDLDLPAANMVLDTPIGVGGGYEFRILSSKTCRCIHHLSFV